MKINLEKEINFYDFLFGKQQTTNLSAGRHDDKR